MVIRIAQITKIDLLNKRLREVVKKFDELQKSGMDEEILEIYLQSKTKLSKKNVKSVLKNMDEFYHKLVRDAVIEEL